MFHSHSRFDEQKDVQCSKRNFSTKLNIDNNFLCIFHKSKKLCKDRKIRLGQEWPKQCMNTHKLGTSAQF